MRQLYFAAPFTLRSPTALAFVAVAALVAGCNLVGPGTATSGELFTLNGSTNTVLIRTTKSGGEYGSSPIVVYSIGPGAGGFVASLGNARVEVLNATTCAVLATLDPIRGRVNALIKNDGSASFEGLPPDSSTLQPSPEFQTSDACG